MLLCTIVAAVCSVPLPAGAPMARPLAAGQVHSYTLSLNRGEIAHVTVAQRGTDVVVGVRDPRGAAIDEVQDERRRDRDEQIDIFAAEPGTYTLEIAAAEDITASGGYAITLVSRAAGTAADAEMQAARSVALAAARLEASGSFKDARAGFEAALATAERVRGPQDMAAARLAFFLAGNALEMHDDVRARVFYERAAAAFERLYGPDHPYTAMAQSRLAVVFQHMGQRQTAEATVRRAMAALERALGPDHPWVLRSLVTLANIRDDAGQPQEAEKIDRAVLAALERIHPGPSLLQASLLNNLAEVLRQRRDPEAEALFRRSLAVGEQLRGPDSYFVSTALQNLGIIARERKDYAAARAYYARALEIRIPIVGSDHPDVAQLLNNLANVERATGNEPVALGLYAQALHTWERTAGPYGRGTLLGVGNIARTHAAMGNIPQAVAFQQRADAIIEAQIALNLAAGSERQKLAFVSSVAERTDRTLSLHLLGAPTNADAAALAALVVLQRKGRVQDAMSDVFGALRVREPDAEHRALMDRLKEANAELARLALDGRDADGQNRCERIATLEGRRDAIERDLSERSAAFRSQNRRVTLDAVQTAIPEDAALIEFAVFRPFDPAAEANAVAYGAPRYAAYVIRRNRAPVGVDLGSAVAIERAIAQFRSALRDPTRRDVKERARTLDERVLRPLRASLEGATRLLISPDGDLNLVPFEALVDEHGHYLIEQYTASYLTSGRDLLRAGVAPGRATAAAVILANPQFSPTVGRRAAPASPPTRSAADVDVSSLYFAPLKATAAEALAIRNLFPGAALLTGSRATKGNLEAISGPRILHIASHGFFLADATGGTGASGNPLLRSGLALAGANVERSAGLMTALEASGLDLWGTELVTLSACDTGVGEVRTGDGVYGLRRAFVLAGAQAVVMSLWPVRDDVARDTMVAYYQRLRAGGGRGDALRDAKLAILRNATTRHPYFWAAFIQSGDSRPLSGG